MVEKYFLNTEDAAKVCYILDFDGLVFPSFEESLTMMGKKGKGVQGLGQFNRVALDRFLRGDITQATFARHTYADSVQIQSLPHLHKIRSNHVEIMKANDLTRKIVSFFRKKGDLVCGGGNVFPWYSDYFPLEKEKEFDYLFFSCEVGSLVEENSYRHIIRNTLVGEGFDSDMKIYLVRIFNGENDQGLCWQFDDSIRKIRGKPVNCLEI